MKRLRPAALAVVWITISLMTASPFAQAPPVRSSIVEDRAARKLIEAGDARYEADEGRKAVEVWQSVIERYPGSRMRFQAHMRLGNYFLERDRAYDRARVQFDVVASEENRDEDQRGEAVHLRLMRALPYDAPESEHGSTPRRQALLHRLEARPI